MEKKDLKFYEAPAVELVDLEVEGQLLAGSTKGVKTDDFDDSDFVDPEAQP